VGSMNTAFIMMTFVFGNNGDVRRRNDKYAEKVADI